MSTTSPSPLTLLCALVLATTASAATIATSPLYQVSPNLNQCIVSNPGTSPVRVTSIEMVNLNGTVIENYGELTIQPGRVLYLDHSGGGITYCRVTGVSAKKIRLTHCVRQTNSGTPCASVATGQ